MASRVMLAAVIALAACSEAQPYSGEPDEVAPAPRESAAVLAKRVAFRRHELSSRWSRAFPISQGFGRRACPAAVSGAAPGSELLVLARDARVEPRQLLPLLLTERLVSAELAALEADVSGAQPAENLAVKLDELAVRRFAGVFHVLDYQAPRRIRRIDRPRPEWVAGILVAQFAVYDLYRHEPLCHAHIVSRNDVSEAPRSRRLEAQVRDRLTRELADGLKQEAQRALGNLGPALALPKDVLHHATATM